MIQHKDPLVQDVGQQIAESIADLERLFKPGAKLTLLVRRPSKPDGSQDIVITNDELGSVVAALEIRL